MQGGCFSLLEREELARLLPEVMKVAAPQECANDVVSAFMHLGLANLDDILVGELAGDHHPLLVQDLLISIGLRHDQVVNK